MKPYNLDTATARLSDAYFDAMFDLRIALGRRKELGKKYDAVCDAAMNRILAAQEAMLAYAKIDVMDIETVVKFLLTQAALRECRRGESLKEEAERRVR
jgi:hypothetical protein